MLTIKIMSFFKMNFYIIDISLPLEYKLAISLSRMGYRIRGNDTSKFEESARRNRVKDLLTKGIMVDRIDAYDDSFSLEKKIRQNSINIVILNSHQDPFKEMSKNGLRIINLYHQRDRDNVKSILKLLKVTDERSHAVYSN